MATDQERTVAVRPQNGLATDLPHNIAAVPESLFTVMWRGRWIILIATVLTLGAGFFYLQKAIPLFESESRVYVEQAGPKVIGELEKGVMTGSKNYLYTQAELIKSGPIVSSAIESFGMRQMKTFEEVDNIASYLTETCLDVTVGKKDDIISVTAKSPYPSEAAIIVNSLVDSYVTYHSKRKKSTSAEVLKLLYKDKELRDSEKRLRLQALMDFRQQNEDMAYESNNGNNILLSRLDRLTQELTNSELAEVESLAILKMTQSMAHDARSLRQYIEHNNPSRTYQSNWSKEALLRTRLNQLESRRAEYRVKHYLDDYPEIVTLDAEIELVKQRITNLDKEYVESQLQIAQQEYAVTQKKTEQLALYVGEQREQALALNKQVAQYTLLQSDWDQAVKTCEILDDRIKELNVTEDIGALNINVLEFARPSEKPSDPQPARVLAMALVLGLMAGGGLALARDMFDHHIRSSEEVTAILDVPLLGTLPEMSKMLPLSIRAQRIRKEPNSHVAEAIRTIRTGVFFSLPPDEARVIQATSAFASAGKSTFMSNLAIAMAQSGQTVLLVDADLRRPVQHKHFKLDRQNGLSSILAGASTLEQAVQQTDVEGLSVLPSGPDVPNPSEMLGSDAFGDIIAELKPQYDRILVDSPPVIPVSDGCVLAAICDVTIMVVHSKKTKRRALQQANEAVLAVGGRLIGSVINGVRKGQHSYGYYYGYKYTGYGKNGKNGKSNDGQNQSRLRRTDGKRSPIPLESYSRTKQAAQVDVVSERTG